MRRPARPTRPPIVLTLCGYLIPLEAGLRKRGRHGVGVLAWCEECRVLVAMGGERTRGDRRYLQYRCVLLQFVHAIFSYLQRSASVAKRVWAARIRRPSPPTTTTSPSFDSGAPTEHLKCVSKTFPMLSTGGSTVLSNPHTTCPFSSTSPHRHPCPTVSPYGPRPTKAGRARLHGANCGPMPKHPFRLLARRARKCRSGIPRRHTHRGQRRYCRPFLTLAPRCLEKYALARAMNR